MALPWLPAAPTANSPDVFEGWQRYPTNLCYYDPVSTRGLGLNRQIDNLSDVLFDEDVKVRVIDVWEEAGALTNGELTSLRLLANNLLLGSLRCRSTTHHEAGALKNAISPTENPQIRIM